MDEQGRPSTWWARLVFPLFQPRQISVLEWRLGLAVIGVALLLRLADLVDVHPALLWDVLIMGTYNGIVWVAGLFSGGGTTEVAAPVLTQVPTTAVPSPSPSPSPRRHRRRRSRADRQGDR